MAYINDGNLYFQNGNNPPQQLTHSGEDWNILFFSENAEKIFFLRGTKPPFELYSITTEGSEEQVLVTNVLLRALEVSYNESVGIHNVTNVPSTHLLLFGTDETRSDGRLFWNNDLLMVDTETAKIRRLLPSENVSDFYVSPNGKFLTVDTIGSIDVFDLDGNIIHKNLLTYTPSEPSFLPPGILWTPDSKGLIILLPVRTNFDLGYISEFTVWRYTLNDGNGIQIPLDILPTEGKPGMVSPDGKWILYNSTENHYGFYLADLNTGHVELYAPEGYISYYWSSDSEHFIYSNGDLYLGSINSPPQRVGRGDFLGWIDSNRYLYYKRQENNIVLGNVDGSQNIVSIHIPQTYSPQDFFAFVLPQASPNK